MPLTFELPAQLRDLNDGRATVELPSTPETVGDALEALRDVAPSVYDRIATERGEVRRHVNLFVGTREIRHTGGLDTPLSEGDGITVLPAVSGG